MYKGKIKCYNFNFFILQLNKNKNKNFSVNITSIINKIIEIMLDSSSYISVKLNSNTIKYISYIQI